MTNIYFKLCSPPILNLMLWSFQTGFVFVPPQKLSLGRTFENVVLRFVLVCIILGLIHLLYKHTNKRFQSSVAYSNSNKNGKTLFIFAQPLKITYSINVLISLHLILFTLWVECKIYSTFIKIKSCNAVMYMAMELHYTCLKLTHYHNALTCKTNTK